MESSLPSRLTPGSRGAIAAGCTCKPKENNWGAGYGANGDKFTIARYCPLHDDRERPAPKVKKSVSTAVAITPDGKVLRLSLHSVIHEKAMAEAISLTPAGSVISLHGTRAPKQRVERTKHIRGQTSIESFFD